MPCNQQKKIYSTELGIDLKSGRESEFSFEYAMSKRSQGKILNKEKEPFVPLERLETIRQKIVSLLEGQTLSIRDISIMARISEKEAYEHLEHIQKGKGKGKRKDNHSLIVTPAECKRCGFVFRKRERLKKPGKCPVCHSESIREPLFSMG